MSPEVEPSPNNQRGFKIKTRIEKAVEEVITVVFPGVLVGVVLGLATVEGIEGTSDADIPRAGVAAIGMSYAFATSAIIRTIRNS